MSREVHESEKKAIQHLKNVLNSSQVLQLNASEKHLVENLERLVSIYEFALTSSL